MWEMEDSDGDRAVVAVVGLRIVMTRGGETRGASYWSPTAADKAAVSLTGSLEKAGYRLVAGPVRIDPETHPSLRMVPGWKHPEPDPTPSTNRLDN
jgi:hypothetical protein